MLIAIGLILFFLFFGIKLQYEHYCKVHKSGFIEAEGMVVDYKKSKSSNGRLYSSIVEYYANGRQYRVVQKSAASWKQPLGKKVPVMYNPSDPTDAVFKNDNSAIILIVFSLLFLFIMFGSVFFS